MFLSPFSLLNASQYHTVRRNRYNYNSLASETTSFSVLSPICRKMSTVESSLSKTSRLSSLPMTLVPAERKIPTAYRTGEEVAVIKVGPR
jgi:hypothetical protein